MDTNDTNIGEKKENEKKEIRSLHDMVRRMMLAGIGAIALKHDEMEEFVDKLVERGEIAKKDGEKLMDEMREHRKQHFHEEESFAHKKVSEIMDHLAVPTKKDFDALNDKISTLEQKIDQLTKSKNK